MSNGPGKGVHEKSPMFRLSMESRDRHPVVTWIALLGVATAVMMAVWGLPPIDLHGPLHRYGIMDPLCGGTRAAYYTARGNLGRALQYNPLGVLVVIGGCAAVARSVSGLVTRRWLTLTTVWTSRRRWVTTMIVLGLLVALEVRQQLNADLLTAGTWMS